MNDLIARLQDMVDFKHDDMDVAREAIEEITHLRAELTTARREGMEEAAKITLKLRDEWRNPEQRGGVAYAEAIAAAIRAAAKEGE